MFVKLLWSLVKAHPEMLTWALRALADYLDKNPKALETISAELAPKA